MTETWTVLASGSGGNTSLLTIGQQGLLVDLGLGPRQFENRFRSVGFAWDRVRAVVLTHAHADHWHDSVWSKLIEHRIPFYCHASHVRAIQLASRRFPEVLLAGLVRNYTQNRPFQPLPGVRCRAFPVKHDGGPTFGFRLEDDTNSAGVPAWAVGYVADLGTWDRSVALALADVDLLAVEFNHDVDLQRASGRARWLINRVLSDVGHLSNLQAGQLVDECLRLSRSVRMQHLIQLHLSGECNRPDLAQAAARAVIAPLGWPIELHTAEQNQPGRTISLTRPRGLFSAEALQGLSPAPRATHKV
ncbi:MAG: MBL fold metallo-hydrolase [Planctomycetes bacterium]|nr:MBL fold metallo-hydrolase [Planctomycetota bacterium]